MESLNHIHSVELNFIFVLLLCIWMTNISQNCSVLFYSVTIYNRESCQTSVQNLSISKFSNLFDYFILKFLSYKHNKRGVLFQFIITVILTGIMAN